MYILSIVRSLDNYMIMVHVYFNLCKSFVRYILYSFYFEFLYCEKYDFVRLPSHYRLWLIELKICHDSTNWRKDNAFKSEQEALKFKFFFHDLIDFFAIFLFVKKEKGYQTNIKLFMDYTLGSMNDYLNFTPWEAIQLSMIIWK